MMSPFRGGGFRTFAVLLGWIAAGLLLGLGVRSSLRGPVPVRAERAPEPTGPATTGAETGPVRADREVLVDLGNADCPVMGRPVDGKTYSVFRGVRIGHCCPPCRRELLEDPERVLDAAGLPWREAAAAAEQIAGSSGEARERALAAARERFGVVPAAEGD